MMRILAIVLALLLLFPVASLSQSKCVLLVDGKELDTCYNYAALVYDNDTGVRSVITAYNTTTCPEGCSWTLSFPLPDEGDVIALDASDPAFVYFYQGDLFSRGYVTLFYSDGRVFTLKGFTTRGGGGQTHCYPPSMWEESYNFQFSCSPVAAKGSTWGSLKELFIK
jgi:hypothetical protein